MSWQLGDFIIPFKIADLSSAQSVHAPIPVKCRVVAAHCVQYAATSGASANLSCEKNGAAISGKLTAAIVVSGAAGDTTAFTDTGATITDNDFWLEEGDSFGVTTDGGSTGTAIAMVMVHMRRAA